MKSIFLTAATCLLLAGFARAQQGGVYLKGGLNFANISTTNDGAVDDANSIVRLHAGVLADLPLTSFFSVQPGLLFTGKGAKLESGDPSSDNYFKATTSPYYLELPVYLTFKLPLTNSQSNIWLGAGPYAAMGVAGRNKAEGKILGVAFSRNESIKFSNDDPTTSNEEGAGYGIMKRFDYGLNGMAGLQLKDVLISVNYGYGLAKLQSGTNNSDNDNNKNRVFSVSLGFHL